jgi:hypothetical protein
MDRLKGKLVVVFYAKSLTPLRFDKMQNNTPSGERMI